MENGMNFLGLIFYFSAIFLILKMSEDMTPKKKFIIILFPFFAIYFFVGQEKINIILEKIRYILDKKNVNKNVLRVIYLLRSNLQAGAPLPQSLTTAAKKGGWGLFLNMPLNRIANYLAQGKSIREALKQVADSMEAKPEMQHAYLMFSSLLVTLKNGGNFIVVLDNIQERIVRYMKIEKKLQDATAQMRFQARIITLAPTFLFFFLLLFSPDRLTFFAQETMGHVMFIFCIILNIIGVFVIRRLLQVK
jgi:tight adherence protein B